MLGEILAVSAVGAVAVTLADHENLFQNNPEKKFWWERVQWPWVPPPATTARFIQPAPRLSPRQELMKLEQTVIASEQMRDDLKRRYPELGGSKYVLTS